MTRYFDWRLTLAILTPLILAALGSVSHGETIEVERSELEQIRDDITYAIGFYRANLTQLEKTQAGIDAMLSVAVAPADPKPQLPEVVMPPVAGWTALVPSEDSRIIYVANPPMGDDSNSGLAPDDPVASPERGYQLMRDGYPDHMLLRAGDEFSELPAWLKSGRSEAERMVIGVYGPPEAPRPIFTGRLNSTFWQPRLGDLTVKHLAFVGLHARRSDDGKPIGLRWLMQSQDILIEDCVFEGFQDNIVIQADWDKYEIQDVAIRRCIVIDATSEVRGQGLYAIGVRGLLIEENIFDHNGQNPGTHDIYNHNLYIAEHNEGVVVQDNISTRAISHGLQMRPGGRIENNLFAFNPIGLFTTRADSIVRGNVVLFGSDMPGGGARGWGIQIGTGDSDLGYALVHRNIIAWNRGSQKRAGIEVSGTVQTIDLLGNVVHDWHRKSGVAIDVQPRQVGMDKDNRTVTPLDVDPAQVEVNVIELIAQERTRPRGAWYRGAEWSAREVLE